MAMISPICLENLVDIGKWMGLAEQFMEMSIHEQQVVIDDEDLGQGAKFKGLTDYYLMEMDGAAQRMMQFCPQMPPFSDPGDDPRVRLGQYVEAVQAYLADNDLGNGLNTMRNVEEALMEWVNDIAFAEPSRVAVRK
jgi:hypothetical protein